MSTLQSELDRLYRTREQDIPNPHGTVPDLVAPGGRVRAMVLALARPADWALLSTLWRGVQTELELPAPAIAVSGIDAYQLWFSLAEPVSVVQAVAFLELLRVRYLSSVVPARLSMMPSADAANPAQVEPALWVPALQPATGRWSAFIAPDLAAIFAEEPWLDLPPNPDAQANMLSRLESIKPAAFQAALARLRLQASPATPPMASVADEGPGCQSSAAVTAAAVPGHSLDPKGFLLGVMNDRMVELHLRIEAAKALLPNF